jgi:tripartite-type tricarboxylate transporter receptor subunit TctC
VPEFIAYAKANPGKINMATSGNGTPQHIAAELFTMMAGIDVLHVPYRSTTPALVDLLAGQVQVIFDTVPASIEFIRAGKLRPLGVTTTSPLDVLPGIPTVAEAVPGYEASAWQGVGAPKGTPAEIIDLLNKQINAALADQKIKQRFVDLGAVPIPMTPPDFAKMIAAETEKFSKVIKFASIKPE